MEKSSKPARLRNISPEDMSREQLLERIVQLEKHVTNLRNVIAKSECDDGKNKQEQLKSFDFNKYNTRHVALKLAYLGWDYSGYTTQEDNHNTVEQHLFTALHRTRLIEAREQSNYHRCGRTDKGVSAFSQVISLDLRTNLLEGRGVKVREGGTAHQRTGETKKEIPYCVHLNRVLPPEIRVLAWCPVDPDFSARFSCKQRMYKYYFPKATMDIEKMNMAAAKLVGSHDFRNLCKMDVANGVTAFIRNLKYAGVQPVSHIDPDDPCRLYELTIVSNAFLWHQIRCIVAVLFMVGDGKEAPEIIDQLLDVESNPRKPQYSMASELPLVLFDCQYEDVEWITDEDCHIQNLQILQGINTQCSIKSAMVRSLLKEVENTHSVDKDNGKKLCQDMHDPVHAQLNILIPDGKRRIHKPLLERQKCGTLEDRIQYFVKKRKIVTGEDDGCSQPLELDESS